MYVEKEKSECRVTNVVEKGVFYNQRLGFLYEGAK